MSWWWNSAGKIKDNNSTAGNSVSGPQPSSHSLSASESAAKDSPSNDGFHKLNTSHSSSNANETPSLSSQTPLTTPPTALDAPRRRKRPAESLGSFPETMSCSQAFDNAFYCQSFGGQFLNVYRYGGLRDCSEHWSDFWFCMRKRSASEDHKRSAIKERFMQKEEKYYTGPSSEDVWNERDRRVDNAFDWDPDEAGLFEKRSKP